MNYRVASGGVTFLDVHVRGFPMNAQLQTAQWEDISLSRVADSLEGITLSWQNFRTLGYNDTPTIMADVTARRFAEACDSSALDDLSRQHGYSPAGARIIFNHTGCVMAMYALEIPSSAVDCDGAVLLQRGQTYFRAGCPAASIVYTISRALVDAGILAMPASAPYDFIDKNPDCQRFVNEMEWRAWASSSHLAIGAGASSYRWHMSSTYPYTEVPRTGNPRVATIDRNYLGWTYETDSAHSPVEIAFDMLEPVAFIMARRSICASAFHNMRMISTRFAYEQPIAMSADDLRRYIALVRTNLMACQIYEESSDKGPRQVYEFMNDHLGMDHQISRLEQAMDALTTSISGMEIAHEERFQRRISFVAVIFTCLTFVSVVAAVSGFVDAENTLFDLGFRAFLVAASLALSGAFVALLWWVLGQRNPFTTPGNHPAGNDRKLK